MPHDNPATARTLVELLRHQADRYQDKVAFIFAPDGVQEQSRLTYAELDRSARAIAAGLQQQGATGRRVLVVCQPGLDSVAAYFGCLYAGAVAVPVQDRLGRLTLIAPDARAGFALADSATQDKLRPRVDGMTKRPLRWLDLADPGTDPDSWSPPDIDAGTTAMLQYTSGSTRAPKGVVLTHGNLLANLAAIQEAWGGDEHKVAVCWLPQHHDMGLIGGILQTVYVGGNSVLMSPAGFITRPMRWLEAMSRYRATTATAPNFAYQLCVERSTDEERAALDLSHWSTAMNGAEPVQATTLRAFAEAFAPAGFRPEAFLPVYGLAEATLLVSGGSDAAIPVVRHIDRTALGEDRVVEVTDSDDDPAVVELVGCGRPRGGQQIVIADPETRRRRDADQVGEIWISGPCVAHGYRGKPEDTEQTFGAYLADTGDGPYLRTGDLGFLLGGEVFITGRCKDLIILRGNNYYPNDIEKTVQGSHRALLSGRGAAFSVAPNPGAGEQLVVIQEISPAGDAGAFTAVLEAIKAAIARYHGIEAHALVLVEPGTIPTTSSGKIQRQAARQRFLDGGFTALAESRAAPSAGAGPAEPAAAERTADAARRAVALQYWKSRQG